MSDQSDKTKDHLSFDAAKFAALEPVLSTAQKIGALSGAPIFCAALKTGSRALNLAASNDKAFLVMSV